MSMELQQALEQVARRFRHVRLWSGLALCWLAWALVGLGLSFLLSRPGMTSAPIPGGLLLASFASLTSVTAIACVILALRSARDPRWVARRIEARHPELGTGLLAAVEQDATSSSGGLGFLQNAVIREALEHSWVHDWDQTVPTRRLLGLQLAHASALALLIVAFAALVGQARTRPGGLLAMMPVSLAGTGALEVTVEPGNTELERGGALLVVARFKGGAPADANLVVGDDRSTEASRPMTRSLEDPTFAGRVEPVNADLAYRVAFAGRETETYTVRVFEYPELQRTDARLVFPHYTSLEQKNVDDIRHVTAVEGTELTLLCRLNKDVAVARLVDEKGKVLELTPHDEGTHTYRTTFVLADSHRYRVQLVDRDKRPNKLPAEIVVNVTRNHPPVVKMTQPAHDVRVSPVEELTLKAELEDDFGLVRQGISYTLAGQEPREIALKGIEAANQTKTSTKGNRKSPTPTPTPTPTPAPAPGPTRQARAEHLLAFESLRARPDQLVTYFFWAEDVGPDGQPRRTSGDMFFAEVRPFEEIFRQGEQPPSDSAANEDQQQGGNAQEAGKLAELQKEIINGTWKLIRRETGAKPSARFADDSKLLRESQHSAIEQAAQLAEKLRDPVSKANLDQATQFMKDAEKHLAEAVAASSIAPQRPALVAEQSAYQALLKLRAREFNVVRRNSRQRQQGGGAGGGGPSDRQLQQLELTDEENRYEQQRSARAQQDRLSQREKEQQETRQVLNRLRELAQRQTDLNDRLKELQSALEAAKDAQARAEIERQLKRLRDQEQQILRDTDELQERMEREENRDRMAEARQQMEQGREHVRQASEALEEGRLSQAVTEGARAGRQLNDLREELRKKASDRFSEEMTDMRNQARQLDENQRKLSDELDAWNRRPQQSLRDNGERQQARQGLEQQGKQLDQLLDRMRNTVQDAEETEPLLAKELFDTVRKANEQTIPDSLKNAEQLVDLGVPEEAVKSSRRAGQGLEQLRQGVERAARSVLGDETSALRRAQGELEDLADEVNREIARATGREPTAEERLAARPGREGDPNRPRPGARDPQQEGQPGEGDPQEQGGQQGQQGRQGGQGQQKGQQRQQGGQGQQGQQGEQQGQQGGQGQQGQQGQQGGQGQQQGQQGQQGGQGQQQGQQGGQGQQGEQQGQQGGQGQQQGRQGQGPLRGGNTPQERQAGSPRGGGGGGGPAGLDRMLEGLTRGGPGGPITGEGFRQWSDRMRDVEELLDDPEMRAEAARIRDRARGAREEFKRHSKEPDWNQLKSLVADPIHELRDKIAEEVRRRESPDALVPIDRDPVPPQFAEGVRRYYERLGSGQ